MKILYVIEALDLGGAEQVVIHLAQGLDRSRFQPLVACLTEKGRFTPALEKSGVPVFCLEKRPRLDWPLIPRLQQLIRRESIDLLHSHLFTGNLWGRLGAWRVRVPIVVTEHSVDTWKPPLYRWSDRLLKPLTTHWIFVSQQVREFYERHLGPLGSRASVIYNGVPLPAQPVNRSQRRPLTLATVGRLAPEKEQVRFVELIGHLRREGLPVRGLIIGDGPQRAAIEQAVKAHHIEEAVQLTGFVSRMEEYWPQVDIFCLTSSREGLPLTALEAMSYGIPVLSTAVGGVRECIEDGREGVLVPFGDWPALQAQAKRLVQDEPWRRQLGEAGRVRVQRQFSLQQMVAQHEALYQRLSESKGERGGAGG